MASEAPADGEKKAEGKKVDSGTLLKIVFLVINLIVTGAGGALVYMSTLGHKPTVVTDEEVLKILEAERGHSEDKPIIYTMDQFTVNLDGKPMRVVQTELNLEMLDEEGFEEVVSLGAQARDAIVRILNSKTFDDIETIQGKLHLKDQIRMTLNQHLKKGVVKDVYFSHFYVR